LFSGNTVHQINNNDDDNNIINSPAISQARNAAMQTGSVLGIC
jgi:hypothetical protein